MSLTLDNRKERRLLKKHTSFFASGIQGMREARDEKSDRQAEKASPNEADRWRKCFTRKSTHAKAGLYVYRQEYEGIGAGTP